MATIYSVNFAIHALAAGTPVAVWTVPSDGATYIVRSVGMWQNGTGAGALLCYDSSGIILASIITVGQNDGREIEMRQVIPNGVTIDSLSVTTGSIRISGYRLVA
jgi:hypothetical protein